MTGERNGKREQIEHAWKNCSECFCVSVRECVHAFVSEPLRMSLVCCVPTGVEPQTQNDTERRGRNESSVLRFMKQHVLSFDTEKGTN